MTIDIGRDVEIYVAALASAALCGWTKAKVGDKTPPSRKQVLSALNDRFGVFICSENLTRSVVNAARCAFFERKNVWPKNHVCPDCGETIGHSFACTPSRIVGTQEAEWRKQDGDPDDEPQLNAR